MPTNADLNSSANSVRDAARSGVILISATLLMLAWHYFGMSEFAVGHLTSWLERTGNALFAAGAYELLSAFLLLGLIPLLIVALGLRESLPSYGLSLGVGQRTVRLILLGAPLFALAGYIASSDPAVTAEYPVNRAAGESVAAFAVHVACYLLFYFGWEFMFRGYLLFGIAERHGVVIALLVQTMASSLLHIGKPTIETFLAVPAGLLWGWVALRSRSILPSFVQHATLGITLDALIVFG